MSAYTAVTQQTPKLGFKSLQQSLSRDCILLLGQPKHGKTTCALTASTKYDPTKRGDGVVVDDIGIITCDATALAFQKATGYEFKYWLDMSDFLDAPLGEFNKLLASGCAEMKKLAGAGKIHTLVVDPISTIDGLWRGELAKNYEGWPLQDKMDGEHKRLLLEKIMSVPCNLILTMHTKTVGKMDDDKRATLGLDKEDRLVMDISSWNAPKMYRAQSSLILPVKKTWGKTFKDDAYAIYPRGVDGIESGGRYPEILAQDKLPANMASLFAMIKESNKTKEVKVA